MHTVTLLGAGKIGFAISGLLGRSGRYKIKLGDIDGARARGAASAWPNVESHQVVLGKDSNLESLLKDSDAVISALPFFCNVEVAKAALATDTHYFDLTEDVETTRAIVKLSENAKVSFVPQCGLAPGFVSIAANYLTKPFAEIDSIKMRVGALPIFPSNRLKYNLTWSTEGLINEYGNMCEAISNGKQQMVMPLEGYERFSLDGVEYEAFNTSGGLGSLCETLDGKVKELNYKSVRYPGHRDLIAFLMHDLGFDAHRDDLKNIFERSLPTTHQDKCIVFVEVRGKVDGALRQRSYANTVYNATIGDRHLSAIQITTAAGVCAPLDLLLSGKLANRSGFVRCEEIPLPEFLDNEFGKFYKNDKSAI